MPRAKIASRICGACGLPSGSGTEPGLMVSKHNRRRIGAEAAEPLEDEFGSARLSCGSEKRPCASACQISSMQSGTTAPSPSNTLPSMRMRSPDASGVTRLLLKASFQSYLPFEVRP